MSTKYQIQPPVSLSKRIWPDNQLVKSPQWCSLDLYLGTECLLIPMDINQKLKFYNLLVAMGFNQIALSNPAIYQENKGFIARLLEKDLIADDIFIQVNVGHNKAVIEQTIPLLTKLPQIILQLEIPVSTNFSSIVLNKTGAELCAYAEKLAQQLSELISDHLSTNQVILNLSLEDFFAADPQLAVDVAHKIYSIWQPLNKKIIIHLPATIDYDVPSHYPDRIEWFKNNFNYINAVTLSIFAKNNRGNANALIELGLMAGASRVEGTLFGIGERSGNNDLISSILNLQGLNIDTGIVIDEINRLAATFKECTHTTIPMHHPYSGELAFSAVSPSQQHIIKKGLERYESSGRSSWSVPYFNINPTDIGRIYEAISYQNIGMSEKSLIQPLLNDYGFKLPELLALEFSAKIKALYNENHKDLTATELRNIFYREYVQNLKPIELISINFEKPTLFTENEQLYCQAEVKINGKEININGSGLGTIDTLVNAIKSGLSLKIDIAHYSSHALTQGSNALAATYIKIVNEDSHGFWGGGIDADTTLSGIKAFFNALNRNQNAMTF